MIYIGITGALNVQNAEAHTMVDTPNQDRKLNLPRVQIGKRFVTAYDPHMALAIIERIAEGEMLSNLCKPGNENGFCARTSFNAWVAREPELRDAFFAAKILSAHAMEEEAIDKARVTAQNPGTTQHVRAAEVLISQLRWSAARRDPKTFGDRGTAQIVVPIHINTTLDLGDGATKGISEISDIYTIIGKGIVEVPLEQSSLEDRREKILPTPTRLKPGPKSTKRQLTPRLPMGADVQAEKAKRQNVFQNVIEGDEFDGNTKSV
jgi:hypothetical protein